MKQPVFQKVDFSDEVIVQSLKANSRLCVNNDVDLGGLLVHVFAMVIYVCVAVLKADPDT